MEGEEAAPLVDPAVVLTLRGRVEAASGADIARALPSSLYEKWLLFATAPAPELLNIPGKGVFLAKSDTQASSYAFYFEPIFVQEAAGAQFKLKCRAGGCGTVCSYAIKKFDADAIKYTFPFANAMKHLVICPGRPILTVDDFEKETGSKKRKSELLQAAGGGGCEGVSAQDAVTDHLEYLRLDNSSITEAMVVASVCDAQPLSSSARLGATFLWRLLRIPKQSETTLRRTFEHMYSEWVRTPLRTEAAAATGPIVVVIGGGYQFELAMKMRNSSDGWGRKGKTFESVIGHTFILQKVYRDIPSANNPLFTTRVVSGVQLLPHLFHIGLVHWPVGQYGHGGQGGFCANAHADLLCAAVKVSGQEESSVAEWIMDTTNGNPAVLREVAWKHCEYVECFQHLVALAVQDTLEVVAFLEAHECAHEMAKFLCGSSRRMEALAVLTPLVPVMQSKTRFASAFAVCRRTVQLFPALTQMHSKVQAGAPLFNGDHAADSVKTVEAFKGYYAKLAVNMPVIEGLARLSGPFLGVIARMGSDSEYTSSLPQVATRELISVCAAEGSKYPVMFDICMSLQNSLMERCASHATVAAMQLQGWLAQHKAPSFMQPGPAYDLRLKIDARQYAAEILDPANSHMVLLRPGNLEDAVAYFYLKILRPGAKVQAKPALPEQPVVPESKADLKSRLAAIAALPKPFPYTTDEYWASYKKEEASQLLAGWKNRDHVKALAGEGEDQGDDHDGGDQDECAPLIDVLRSEMMQYRAFLDTQAKLFMQHRDEWGKAFPAPFGLPLGPKVDARYEFWPQRKKEWPLLYFCATQLLAGSKASSCSNERTHSVAGRICSKLRGSLQPSSIEKLTLAYHYIRREVKETLAKWGKEAEAKLDKEDLEMPELLDASECKYFLLSAAPPTLSHPPPTPTSTSSAR